MRLNLSEVLANDSREVCLSRANIKDTIMLAAHIKNCIAGDILTDLGSLK